MAVRYRDSLPQVDGDLFLTDGGAETTLIFHRGIDLPEFAAFTLLDDPEGIEELRRYFRPYLRLASEHGAGFVLESPTWRASQAWGDRLGRDAADLERLNRRAIGLMEELRSEAEEDPGIDVSPIVISGCIGPHDDGYSPSEVLSAEAAMEGEVDEKGNGEEISLDFGDEPTEAVEAEVIEEEVVDTKDDGEPPF